MTEARRGKLTFSKALLLVVVLVLAMVPAGCTADEGSGFPALTTSLPDGTGSSETTTAGSDATEPVQQLTVALPLDGEGLEALRLLFLARQSGLIRQEPGQYIGLQILPDDLRQFDNGMILNLLPVSAATGATTEQIDMWRSSGSMPDLVYSRSAAETVGLDECLDLTGYLYANKLLTADRVNIPALENCRSGALLYSIPYLASFPVIYINNSLLMQMGLEMPAKTWSWGDWQAFAANAQLAIDQAGLGATQDTIRTLAQDEGALAELLARSIYVTDDLSGLLEWLPAAFEPSAGWAMWDGQRFDYRNAALDQAVEWLSANYLAGYSTLHLTEEQRLAAFNAVDAVRSGRVLMWAGDSADLDTWRQAGLQVKACLMPTGLAVTDGQQPIADEAGQIRISVRSIAVSQSCRLPELAADLAAFIALDADALLLQSRYRLFSGLSPLINDATVQQTLLAGQADWSWLLQSADRLPTASCSGQQVIRGWEKAVEVSLGAFGPVLLKTQSEGERAEIVRQMILAAQNILQEE